MLIRNAVEAGHVDEAVRRVNELEPEVSILIRHGTRCSPSKGILPQRLQRFMHHSYAASYGDPETYITDLI